MLARERLHVPDGMASKRRSGSVRHCPDGLGNRPGHLGHGLPDKGLAPGGERHRQCFMLRLQQVTEVEQAVVHVAQDAAQLLDVSP